MAATMAIFSLVLLAMALGAAAHGGHLHAWPSTPSGSNYIRTKIASCSNWVPASGPVKYSLVSKTANLTSSIKPVVKGDVIVWTYLYSNCSLKGDDSPSAGVEFNVQLLSNGKPYGGVTLDGVAMTGSCASGGGTPYYFDPQADPVDDDENLLWFHNFTVPANGSVRGNGANDGIVSTLPTQQSIRSVVLVATTTGESLACCDLTVAGPADTDWAATLLGKGVPCDEDKPAKNSTAVGAMNHSMHGMEGMDHSKMNHSEHGNETAASVAAAAPAAAARSSAGTARGTAAAAAAVASAILAVVACM